MAGSGAADVLIVSLGSTEGLRRADEALAESLRRAGAEVLLARSDAPSQRRTLMLTDLAWARSARAAACGALTSAPRAVIYSTTTAALLWPRVGAIRFDAPAAANRPGRHGLWQRPLERRRLAQAPLLLPWSEGGAREAFTDARAASRTLVLPVAVAPSPVTGAPLAERDVAAVTYAANPGKKGLDRVLAAWRALRSGGGLRSGEELLVLGTSPAELARAGIEVGGEPDVRVLVGSSSVEFRSLLRRARVFVCAPRREDYGIAQLEALADGCMLVSTPAPGPYAALPIATTLDRRLIGPDLAAGLRAALREPLQGYGDAAAGALSRYAPATVDGLVAQELLPRLLAPH